jgi:uncharacterized protein (TIGR02466 family)
MIEIDRIFPTCIVKSTNLDIAASLLSICDKYLPDTDTALFGVDNFPTTYNSKLNQEVNSELVVRQVLSYIINNHAAALAEECGIPYNEIKFNPYGFFHSMKQYAYMKRHMHSNATFSGIVYLDIGEDVPPIVFHDPRTASVFGDNRSHEFEVKPETGMIMLWNAWLEHEIPQKLNDNVRKVFAFNI